MAQYIYGRNTVKEKLQGQENIEEAYILEGLKDDSLTSLLSKKKIKTKVEADQIAVKHKKSSYFKVKVENKVSISVVGNIAYITYNSSKKSVEFHRMSTNEGNVFFKKRNSHMVKLYMEDSLRTKEIYFVLEKNGKKKVIVTLIRV